jgi:hypothetical protein
LFSQSTESSIWMGTFHLIFWFIAALFGWRFVSNAFSHSQAKSTLGFSIWILMFMLVAIQMTTALRPIIGTPGVKESFFPDKKQFFLGYWADCLKEAGEKQIPDRNDAQRR